MKELKDIKLKRGDVLFFDAGEIIKIDRPVKYKTIYEAPKPILDKKEKEYLEAVIRPFTNGRIRVVKSKYYDCCHECENEQIIIMIEDWIIEFPPFIEGTMYKGMELNKEYTLDELGLFKE